MGEHTSKQAVAGDQGRSTLGELMHVAVRSAIETAVEAELAATLGAGRYERRDNRRHSHHDRGFQLGRLDDG
jgi:hypothetical protein